MTIRLIIFLTFLVPSLFGQTSSDKKHAEKYKKCIDKKLKQKKLTSKTYPEMSLYGGSLTGYYSDNKLVLITADHDVAYCSNEYSYYIKNDSLVFVTEQITKIKEPDNFDEYIEKHTDKSNNTDLSKLPLEIDDDNKYYFQDNKIVDCRMKSFKKKITITQDIVAKKNKVLVMFYKSHLDELKTVK